MKRYKYLIFLVLASLVITGCTGGVVIVRKGNIIGQVYSSTGAVLEGAYVEIDGKSRLTDGNGVFDIRDVASGVQTITISHPSFQELRTKVTIPANGTAYHAGIEGFYLVSKTASTGSIAGEVLFAGSRNPVKDARVSIGGRVEYTDAWGEFVIDKVPSGSQQLRVTHSEFSQSFERSVTIEVNKRLELYGNNAIVVERWQPPAQTGSVEGYIYVRSGSQMSAASLEEIGPLFSAQATPPSGFEPLTDATVRIGGRNSSTNWDGMFSISGITPGTYTLTVTSPSLRFTIEKKNVGVYAGQVTRFTGSDALYGGIGYYVVIGIGDYPGEPTIPGSVANAQRVYDALFDRNQLAGLGELLTDRNATKTRIKAAIGRAIDQADSLDDYLVIYFSGLSGQDYLSPSDDPGGDWSKVITDTDLERWVSDFPGSVTLIIDGSESSTMADGFPFQPLAFRKHEYTVISAAGPRQGIFYDPSLGSSVFTHFLVKGISGWYPPADLNGDGDITASELYQYVYSEMDDYLWGDPDRHLPSFWGTDYGYSVIFRY
mgnify:CR=1 FL=1|jgi:hypothetical protein